MGGFALSAEHDVNDRCLRINTIGGAAGAIVPPVASATIAPEARDKLHPTRHTGHVEHEIRSSGTDRHGVELRT